MKKFYSIDNATKTISADLTKLNGEEKELIKDFISLGYTFVQKNSRKGANRKRSHFESILFGCDMEIFDKLAATKKQGAYATATSFASTIVKLGKLSDAGKIDASKIDEYRKLASDGKVVEAKIFAKNVIAAAA